MLELCYYPLNASMAVRFTLEKLGVPYKLTKIDRRHEQQKTEAYLALNPTGRIPTLIDGDLVLFESAAISLYLISTYAKGASTAKLVPLDIAQRAKFDQWLMYLCNTLQSELMVYLYPERYADNRELEKIICDSAELRINEMLELLNRQLANSNYLLGQELSICDYFLFMLSVWADELSKPPLSYDHLGPYLKRLARHPEVQTVCINEHLNLEPYLN